MRVRVRGANGAIIFSRTSETLSLFLDVQEGESFTRTNTEIVSARLMEQFLTIAPPDEVQPTDRIFVRLQYSIQGLAMDGGEFVLDFDAPDAGINVPMVVVNY